MQEQTREDLPVTGKKLSFEEKAGIYQVSIVVDAGADIPPGVLNLLKAIASSKPNNLSEDEVRLIERVFSQDLKKLDSISRVKVKNLLEKANIKIDIHGKNSNIEFQGTFGLTKLYRNFIGRGDQLVRLERAFEKPWVLTGTGGVGKTQIANFFAFQSLEKERYKWVVWFTGEIDEKIAEKKLWSQFKDLVVELGFDICQPYSDNFVDFIYKQLFEKGPGLVVFDDVPNYAIIKTFLPKNLANPGAEILITTRSDRYFGSDVNKISVGIFSIEDAAQYIKGRVKNASSSGLDLLANTLGGYLLVLT